MQGLMLQPWTTVQSSFPTLTQSVEDWLDLCDYADATFWIDVTQISSGSTVQLTLQTSPTLDESYFFAAAPPITLATSTAPQVLKTVRSAATVPLAKYVRWQLTLLSGTSPWSVTFRVRVAPSRQSFFVPTQLAGCVLWLRADLGITLNSGNVSGWADQSGHGNNASQINTMNQPPYVQSQMNGQPALRGDGAHFGMVTSAFTLGASATLFVATQPSTGTQSTYARMLEQQYSLTYYLGSDVNGTAYKLIVNNNSAPYGTANGGTVTSGANTIVAGEYLSPTGTLYVNGASVGTGTFTAPSNDNQAVSIMQSFQAAQWWNGYFAEAIIYNRALSTSELNSVHQYLGARYGVALL